ncbi:hypothetical protein N7468_004488 [Penicillium chermesinum]|uniref:Uncharacterized protein n=1 Tax=Penicillium chermesinum TaxID=63820 RepID=A0A9W9P8E3_9EURO|nr:uncharacterized protein N7468_004488 [Penicillium chermesinum]KAJ5239869.1 hypothetical protein N7468_004488 [Penicillium chermesinum]KAJ6166749.1 hypothetical protein N7470_002196 [Penicillium chermesinum]
MSEISVDGQESKAVPCYHDQLPPYRSKQPNQDMLTSIIETEHTRRILKQRIDDFIEETEDLIAREPTDKSSRLASAKWLQKCGENFKGMGPIMIKAAGIQEKWAGENGGLYIALSKPTESEFNQTKSFLMRYANQQLRHAPVEDHQGGSHCNDTDSGNKFQSAPLTEYGKGAGDYAHDSICSCDRVSNLATTADHINEKS